MPALGMCAWLGCRDSNFSMSNWVAAYTGLIGSAVPARRIVSICIPQSAGRVARRLGIDRAGNAPLIAPCTIAGLRNDRLIVIRTERSLQRSRAAISFVSRTSPEVSWASQCRAVAMPTMRDAGVSGRRSAEPCSRMCGKISRRILLSRHSFRLKAIAVGSDSIAG